MTRLVLGDPGRQPLGTTMAGQLGRLVPRRSVAVWRKAGGSTNE